MAAKSFGEFLSANPSHDHQDKFALFQVYADLYKKTCANAAILNCSEIGFEGYGLIATESGKAVLYLPYSLDADINLAEIHALCNTLADRNMELCLAVCSPETISEGNAGIAVTGQVAVASSKASQS